MEDDVEIRGQRLRLTYPQLIQKWTRSMALYEQKASQPLTQTNFYVRLFMHFLLTLSLMVGSLGIGMIGYMYLEHFTWVDAFLNTAMLLGGMGPVNPPLTDAGKLFAGFFALYAGLIFIVCGAILITPVVHRVLHIFHFDPGQ